MLETVSIKERAQRLLVVEQPLFSMGTAPVATERTVSADHTVARDDYGERVRAIGSAYGAARRLGSNLPGDISVAARFPDWDCAERFPDPVLEGGTLRHDVMELRRLRSAKVLV